MFIDTLFIILMVTAIFKGYSRGLVVAIFSSLAIFIGIVAAIKLSAVVGNYLQEHAKLSMQWLPFLSFALVMIVVMVLVKLLANIVERTIEFALMGWANKAGGILLYALMYTTLLSVCIFYVQKIGLFSSTTIQDSTFYTFIQPFGPKAVNAMGYIIPIFKDMFTQLDNFFTAVGKTEL